jgi:two-component sensor histidine kinase
MLLQFYNLSLQKIDLQPRILLFFAIIVSLFACNTSNKKNSAVQFKQDSVLVSAYIHKGDSIYAQKENYFAFSESLDLYDSAWHIAENNGDTSLMAAAIFAKGRAYDAINNNPKRTIEYYTDAAKLFSALPKMKQKALYIKHLLAHSYDKIQDSIHCINVLDELYRDIMVQPDSVKEQLGFIPEMALISTVVKNYAFADSILQNLTKRDWIKNDSTEYDYLNHYYLTKAKIAVYQKHLSKSVYLDSLENVFAKSPNLSDSVYYSNELWELNKNTGNKVKENYYLQINNKAFNQFNPPEKVRAVQEKLTKLEIASVEEKRIAETEKAEARKRFIYALLALLGIISLLALFLQKRNKEIRRKKNEVLSINTQLHQKNLQNELLNKEIHHRVKNNLQMILSLVYMQEKKTQADETKSNLQDIRMRIENIAAMHQQLLEQNNNVVDLKQYVMKLVNSVVSLVGNGNQVFTHLDIDEINISSKQSFPLGLLLNELVTNTVKYAIPVDNILAVYVTIKSDNNTVYIQYHDSGGPVKKEQIKAGLGMNIINLLIAQLNGELHRDENNYFAYELKFSLDGE